MELKLEGEVPQLNIVSVKRDEAGDIGFYINDNLFAYFYSDDFVVREYILGDLNISCVTVK